MSAIKKLGVVTALILGFMLVAVTTHAVSTSTVPTQSVQLEVKHVTNKDFKSEVEDSKIPVIVDFYATWCGPCKLLKPNLEKIAAEYKGKVKVVKVDIDAYPDLAKRFAVNRYPTMLTFKDGKMKEMLIGLRSVEQLRSTCDELLK